jgi:trimethylamine:corrinoid methyltransferase-like protein
MQQNGLAIQEGTSAVQTELSALKNLIQSAMQQYETNAENRSADVSVLGSQWDCP